MVRRSHWIETIERLWREKSVVWLSGVLRVGKTFLCFVVTDDTVTSHVRDYRGVAVRFVNLPDLIRRVASGA